MASLVVSQCIQIFFMNQSTLCCWQKKINDFEKKPPFFFPEKAWGESPRWKEKIMFFYNRQVYREVNMCNYLTFDNRAMKILHFYFLGFPPFLSVFFLNTCGQIGKLLLGVSSFLILGNSKIWNLQIFLRVIFFLVFSFLVSALYYLCMVLFRI